MFKLSITLLVIFISILSLSVSKKIFPRFEDGEMMKKHHSHLPENSSSTEEIHAIPIEPINVHLIPHTHDDVGWLKTVDDYYYGNNNSIQNAQVQYVLDTVIRELIADPSKTFIYVEMAFFTRWWNEQTDELKLQVKSLVKNKQLEFINGGWCMNDEAAPYFEDIIDQMTLGHKFLKDTFNYTVKVGWHIDPFGHSAAQASLFSQMGFDAFFFARIDYQDKDQRLENKTMEMIWNPYQASGKDNSIFTHVNYYHYEAPPGFCFDQNCNDDPIMDDQNLELYNIESKAKEFANYFKNMALHYKHNELLHTMGSDFQYSNAFKNFKNMDKLVHYLNNHPELGVNVFYSTPMKYIEAIRNKKISYPVKTDDFFPYADGPNAFWTGYFVSRAALKGYIRDGGRFFQTLKQLFALSQLKNESSYISELKNEMIASVNDLQATMGILQHHDAVAGTSKQQVADDYIYLLARSLDKSRKTLFKYLELKNNEILNEEIHNFQCNWNQSYVQCPEFKTALDQGYKSFLISAYNPGFKRQQIVRIKVPNNGFTVIDSSNLELDSDVICDNDSSPKDCNLYFVGDFDSYSFTYFKINVNTLKSVNNGEVIDFSTAESIRFILNSRKIELFSNYQKFNYQIDNELYPFELSYKYYRSYQGPGQPSGAYIFRPDKLTHNYSVSYSTPFYARVFQSKTLLQISIYGDKITTHLRLYANQLIYNSAIELESFVKPISIEDKIGKEVTLNLQTSIENNGLFQTDSNGLEMQERKLNYRPTWKLNQTEQVAGNYYPINSIISIKDSQRKLSVVTDRSQGGSSYRKGLVEIMIQRRLVVDDWRGVDENLNETENNGVGISVRMRHYLVFSNPQVKHERNIQYQLDFSPLIVLASSKFNEFLRTPSSEEKCMNNGFPSSDNLRLYLQDLGESYLVRVMNNDETHTKNLFLSKQLEEVNLSASETINEINNNKIIWKSEKNSSDVTFKGKNEEYKRLVRDLITKNNTLCIL